MEGIVLLYQDFFADWIEVMKDCGLKKLGLHVNTEQSNMAEFLCWLEANRPLIERAEDRGLTIEYFLHAFGYLLSEDFAGHRENWRQNEDGQRVKDYNCCPSSPELNSVEKNAVALAQRLKQYSHKYHFWVDDDFGKDIVCHCEKCRNYSQWQQGLMLYRAMEQGVRMYDTEALLSYLVYGNSVFRDAGTDLGGFFIEFAPFLRRHDLPLTAKENKSYLEKILSLKKNFSHVDVLEYFLSFDYDSFCRGEQFERVKEDVRFYKSVGVEDVMTFAVFPEKNYVKKYGFSGIEKYAKLWS